ncbi:MAG TPA: tRNA lysidine(34) synthetase TilS [Gammaproteobacteria bacterium]|nr:tRNA lysidine(34) synthetase TilS [Gammaproteobacteria bacterium]
MTTPPPPQADDVTAVVRATLERWASRELPPRITVAFSGGLDSTVLLGALCRLALPVRIRAAHIDHGLQPQSAEWSEHCAATAAALGAQFVTARVAVDQTAGLGLEAAARDVRYRTLGELMLAGEWLLTAHHADDQLETLLLRFMRGTGVRGLRGIIPFGPFGVGALGRPLLSFTRAQLHARALEWNLRWLEDPSNREPRQDRNYLRLHVVPALLARWPDAAQHAERLAEQAGEAERLLDAVAAEDARPLVAPWHVPRTVLAALEPARQRNLLRHVLRAVGLGTPSARKLEELRAALLEAHADSHTQVSWPGAEGRVFRDALYLGVPPAAHSPADHAARIDSAAAWSGPEGRVELLPVQTSPGVPESWLAEGLTLRFRAGGERFRPRGRQHHHSLKDLFQEHGVVPWMRDRVPLLYRGAALVAIGDLWLSADVDAAPATEPRYSVRWTEHPPVRAPEKS